METNYDEIEKWLLNSFSPDNGTLTILLKDTRKVILHDSNFDWNATNALITYNIEKITILNSKLSEELTNLTYKITYKNFKYDPNAKENNQNIINNIDDFVEKFTNVDKKFDQKIKNMIEIMRQDPLNKESNHELLTDFHSLKGNLKGYYAVSTSDGGRIVYTLNNDIVEIVGISDVHNYKKIAINHLESKKQNK
ncbi:MAG: type II toxin-antitoxin system YoeB family toxin [Puniceicoccales bacterium]|nr:type II toxin-antitoxin system YoeB family toxin [Puniceicoccales bacterium]